VIADLRVVGRWMIRVWRPEPGWLVAILGLSVVSAGLNVGFPWLSQYVVDEVRAGAAPPRVEELAAWMLAAGAGYGAVYALLQGARSYMNREITRHLRALALDRLVVADPEALRGWRTGDWVARLHDDADDKSSWFLCSGVFRAYEALLTVAFAAALLLGSEPTLAPWVVAPLPPLLIAQALVQRASAARNREVQAAVSATADELATTFGAIRTVQAARLGGRSRARFEAATLAQQRAEVRAAVLQAGVGLLFQFAWPLALAGLVGLGGLRVIAGEMSLGRFVTMEGLVATLVWPMFDFGTLVSRLPSAAVALRRIDEVLAVPLAPTPDPGQVPRGDVLRVTGLGVGGLLRGVDLELRPGERVAIVGPVGSGKSVLVEVLAGLRTPTAGEVRIGGVAVADLEPGAKTALVPQDPALLSGTIRENVCLGREVSEDALAAALRISQLDRDLAQLTSGLDTRVGERGVLLSGGQRQRVAIARALAGRPAILLLDDATSALDASVEAAFWRALDQERPDIGVVLVTHRVGTLQRADRVVVLAGGAVVQAGTHAELVAREGAYREAYG
jgi:ATP-binding cassette subfamily B protein